MSGVGSERRGGRAGKGRWAPSCHGKETPPELQDPTMERPDHVPRVPSPSTLALRQLQGGLGTVLVPPGRAGLGSWVPHTQHVHLSHLFSPHPPGIPSVPPYPQKSPGLRGQVRPQIGGKDGVTRFIQHFWKARPWGPCPGPKGAGKQHPAGSPPPPGQVGKLRQAVAGAGVSGCYQGQRQSLAARPDRASSWHAQARGGPGRGHCAGRRGCLGAQRGGGGKVSWPER